MAEKLSISLVKMTSIKLFGTALLSALLLSGCAIANKKASVGNVANTKSEVELKQESAKKMSEDAHFNALNNNCSAENKEACLAAANYLYAQGEYSYAAWYYDQICSRFQYVPACLKLAQMLENGTGIKEDKASAEDIYMKACYLGDKPSCSRFKRD